MGTWGIGQACNGVGFRGHAGAYGVHSRRIVLVSGSYHSLGVC